MFVGVDDGEDEEEEGFGWGKFMGILFRVWRRA